MNTDLPLDAAPQPVMNAVSPSVKINGVSLQLNDWSPTGRQLLAAANLQPTTEYSLLLWPEHGPTLELGLDEVIALPRHGALAEFLATQADAVFYFALNDERYAWAGDLTEAQVRQIARIPSHFELWLERHHEPDLLLEPGEAVDLKATGVERLYTRHRVWKLDVHGVHIESNEPTINVRAALILAGIDPDQGWIIRLKVKGEPKRAVELSDNIDLTAPGIERLKLIPKTINNGESARPIRRQFALLPKDEAYLSSSGLLWETVDDGRRWLLVSDYPVPSGYHQTHCNLAIEIPQNYPTAELDMFYCDPPLTRVSGAQIAQTEHHQLIDGRNFQRWSRHRNPGEWSPQRDSVLSHMGLVEESIAKEIEQ
ncbi:multiubiquitin domain-containing protein [Pseudomonas sp. CR3202]|uniref:multiubiquitin domain-containing protein n=1 Tax=Pseudomonas sp. CR3202 TaxID=3351532 RepID=UPI003BF3EA7D